MIKRVSLFLISLFIVLIFSHCNERQPQGEFLYNKNCGSCHLANGEGVGELIPAITTSTIIKEDREQLLCMITNGVLNETGETYLMPANKELSEIELTNLLNYIRVQWHANEPEFSVGEIKKYINNCNQMD